MRRKLGLNFRGSGPGGFIRGVVLGQRTINFLSVPEIIAALSLLSCLLQRFLYALTKILRILIGLIHLEDYVGVVQCAPRVLNRVYSARERGFSALLKLCNLLLWRQRGHIANRRRYQLEIEGLGFEYRALFGYGLETILG